MQERKRQKFEKLKEMPKHVFQDDSYYEQRELREKNLFDSLDKGEPLLILSTLYEVFSLL